MEQIYKFGSSLGCFPKETSPRRKYVNLLVFIMCGILFVYLTYCEYFDSTGKGDSLLKIIFVIKHVDYVIFYYIVIASNHLNFENWQSFFKLANYLDHSIKGRANGSVRWLKLSIFPILCVFTHSRLLYFLNDRTNLFLPITYYLFLSVIHLQKFFFSVIIWEISNFSCLKYINLGETLKRCINSDTCILEIGNSLAQLKQFVTMFNVIFGKFIVLELLLSFINLLHLMHFLLVGITSNQLPPYLIVTSIIYIGLVHSVSTD